MPMKPDMRVLLQEAQRPQQKFVPARAGWNGPEEKSDTATPNPTYDAMRAERTPTELQQQFLAAAIPDWRVLMAICGLIAMMRVAKSNKPRALAPVIPFPVASRALEEAA